MGLTEKLDGTKSGKFETLVEVDRKQFDKLKSDIKAANGDEVKIKAVVDDSQLKNIEGVYNYILKQQKNANPLNQDSINDLIQTQNYTNIADQAFGFSGVNTAIKEYNRIIGDNTENQTKFLEVMGKTNPKLAECMKLHTDGSMGLKDYGKYLVTATLKTIGLEAATMALNMAIGAGVGIKYIL